MTTDPRAELEAELEKPPPEWWQPQKHDQNPDDSYPLQLIGKVVAHDEAEFSSKEGGKRRARGAVIETTDGRQWIVWDFHGHLAKQLRQLKPQVGQQLGVKILGMPEGASGYRYKLAVVGEPETAERFDWGSEARDTVPSPTPPAAESEIDVAERPDFDSDAESSW
jgi:hypothetical protein